MDMHPIQAIFSDFDRDQINNFIFDFGCEMALSARQQSKNFNLSVSFNDEGLEAQTQTLCFDLSYQSWFSVSLSIKQLEMKKTGAKVNIEFEFTEITDAYCLVNSGVIELSQDSEDLEQLLFGAQVTLKKKINDFYLRHNRR